VDPAAVKFFLVDLLEHKAVTAFGSIEFYQGQLFSMWGLYPKRIVSLAKLALECLPVIALATGELAHFYAFGLQVLPQIVQMNEAHAASARTDLQ
jgi:hypothetical protein